MSVTAMAEAQEPRKIELEGQTYYALPPAELKKLMDASVDAIAYRQEIPRYIQKASSDSLTIAMKDNLIALKQQRIEELEELTKLVEPKWYQRPEAVAAETLAAIWVISTIFSNFSK